MKRGRASLSTAGASGKSRGRHPGESTSSAPVSHDDSNNNINGNLGKYMVREEGPTRLARRQRRTGRWRRSRTFTELQKKMKSFDKGASKFSSSLTVTNKDLINVVNKEYKATTSASQADLFRSRGGQVAAAQRHHDKKINSMMKDWMEGGHGYVPTVKPDGTIRILMENWNSLKYFTEKNHDRIHRIDSLRRKYNADILAGCEVQTDWSEADRDKQFDDLFGLGIARRGGAAHNTEDEGITNRCQPGGVAAIAFGKVSEYVKVEPDPTGLGRWITLTLTNGERVSRVVMAYKPGYPTAIRRRGKDKLGSTVWEQHDRYWRKRGKFDDPRNIFAQDLLSLLRKWRAANEEVILMGDFNEDIYKDKLGRALLGEDIQMCEQYHRLCGEKAPFSHITGKRPIMGVFASPGIDCTAALICAHKIGVGDHRMHVFDFSSQSLLGIESPVAKRPSGRNLHCSIERQRVKYNRVLIQLTKRHRMFKKANILQDAAWGDGKTRRTTCNPAVGIRR